MHILAIVWHPNARWHALSEVDKLAYLKSLDVLYKRWACRRRDRFGLE